MGNDFNLGRADGGPIRALWGHAGWIARRRYALVRWLSRCWHGRAAGSIDTVRDDNRRHYGNSPEGQRWQQQEANRYIREPKSRNRTPEDRSGDAGEVHI